MELTELHLAIMNREDIDFKEADKIVNKMKDQVAKGENPDDVLFKYGYDIEYFFDLL